MVGLFYLSERTVDCHSDFLYIITNEERKIEMKTKDGKYNLSKVEKSYSQLREKLNEDELSQLLHLLVEDDFLMLKTVELVQEKVKKLFTK